MRTHLLLSLALLAPLAGCADLPTDPETAEAVAGDDGKADSTTALRVRAGETTLWIDAAAPRARRGGADLFVLHGRTSRDLVDGRAFVFDDINADWIKLSPRTFEIRWSPTAGALDVFKGITQYVGLNFKHSAGRPDSLTGRVVMRPRLTSFTGSSDIYLVAELTPYAAGGRAMFRLRGTTGRAIHGVTVELAGVALPPAEVVQLDSKHFQADLVDENVLLAAGTSGQLVVKVDFDPGVHTKSARIALATKLIGLTTEDPYEVWPPPTCTDSVRACLSGLPPGSVDLSRCGEFLAVNACAASLGATVDGDAFVAGLARADLRLGDPAGFAGDVALLVGADRVDEYSFLVRQSIESRFENLYGRWYADSAARDAALDLEATAAIDDAYARPFDLLEGPHPAAPGDVAGMRQAATDAILLELAGMDLSTTEYGRSLRELTIAYRADYLASLRYFRREAEIEHVVTDDYFIGRFFGSHTEVKMDVAAGAVLSVLFEID